MSTALLVATISFVVVDGLLIAYCLYRLYQDVK